jgi:hypothetical protein
MSGANVYRLDAYRSSANTVHYATVTAAAEATVTADAYVVYRSTTESGASIPTSPPTEEATSAMADITREEIKAQHEAIEARTETKIARIEGKLDLVLQSVGEGRTEARESRRAVMANQWVIFGAVVVVIGIFVTAAPIIFDLGSKWRETISKEIGERLPHGNT